MYIIRISLNQLKQHDIRLHRRDTNTVYISRGEEPVAGSPDKPT